MVVRDRQKPGLTDTERAKLEAIRSAQSLEELQDITGTASEHEAYLAAKADWTSLRDRVLPVPTPSRGLPGDHVVIEDRAVHVHGITHAHTDAERTFLREHVTDILASGGSVFCEQGIRRMYFEDFPDVYETDDYRWALNECRNRDFDSHVEGLLEQVDSETEGPDLQELTERFRDATFSLIRSGSSVYGDQFANALGDIASDFFRSRGDLATGENFESFQNTKAAAEDPRKLGALQRYYRLVLLPQPLEREWLKRHDPELELFTHARNERITAYVLAHAGSDPVHLITGAAHQPGVRYYLEAYRDGTWSYEPFESVP